MKTLFGKILTLAAFLAIATTSFAQYGPRDGDGPRRDGERLKEALDLTDEQFEQIEALRVEHLQKMAQMRINAEKAKLAVKETLVSDEIDAAKYIAAVKTHSEALSEMRVAGAEHRVEIYNLLNDDQKAKWALHMARVGGPNGPGGGKGMRGGRGGCDGPRGGRGGDRPGFRR
jgi:Spy/CpxP family protein refolding chaperone